MPEVRRIPLDRLINDPFKAFQERGAVKRMVTMADLLSGKAAAAYKPKDDVTWGDATLYKRR
jgi:hypothetical protein